MPKIALVANTDWYLYNYRLPLARFLHSQGFEVFLVSPDGNFSGLLQSQGFRWQAWEVGRQTTSPLPELQAIYRLFQIYRKEKISLAHHFTIKPVLYGSIAGRLAGVPAVVNSITGLGYLFLTENVQARFLRMIAKLAYHYAFRHPNSAVIFENASDRQFFIQLGLVEASLTQIIEGVGVDIETFMPGQEPEGEPLVIMPSRLLWDKGVGVLVDATRILKERTAVRVALVGEPDPGNPATVDKATLKGWAAEGVVEWWGFQTQMPKVYLSSHIIALPSMGEGLPTALIEAGACGKPVVTTDVPGCRDVVVDGVNGFLVPPSDPLALASALEKLVCDPQLRARMGQAGREIVMNRFTTTHVNEATNAVYQRLLRQIRKR